MKPNHDSQVDSVVGILSAFSKRVFLALAFASVLSSDWRGHVSNHLPFLFGVNCASAFSRSFSLEDRKPFPLPSDPRPKPGDDPRPPIWI